jgi:heptosyltransferase-2
VPENKEKIAVVLPNHLGDVAMATPALRSLRRGRPEATIRAVMRPHLAPLLSGHPSVDSIVPNDTYATRHPLGRLRRRLRVARRIADADVVVVFPNSFGAALLAFASRAPRRIGYARRGRAALLTDALPAPRVDGRFQPIAMERYYLDLALALGCPDLGTTIELARDAASERECDALFARHGIRADRPLVGIAPGAAFGPSKLWPTRRFAEVAAALAADGVEVALIHAPGEEALAREIREAAPGAPIFDLGGASLGLSLLKSVVARSSLVICNDAGARHLAAAFEVPCLVLMGPTSLAYTNLNLKKTRVLREPVECSPCQRKVCPIDHRCMTRLSPGRVLAEARTALAGGDWRGDVALEYRG